MAGPVGNNNDDDEILSGINITPFVDVVLVILIVIVKGPDFI